MKISSPEKFGFSSERLARIDDYANRYMESGKVAGFVTLVARRGEVVQFQKYGYQDLETKSPMALDTIFRIYSMTKPITSVALMMLFEEGLVRLEDPVSKYLPEFKKIKILGPNGQLEPAKREITIHMLLTHTAGLCYAEYEAPALARYYMEPNIWDWDQTLEEFTKKIADLPHIYHPGEKWYYSMATDVVGRLVEVVSDMPFTDFFKEKIFGPLEMSDTAFSVPQEKENRFAKLYGPVDDDLLAIIDEIGAGKYTAPKFHSGGGGLVSTAEDYFKFAQLVLNKGEYQGVRLLGPRTVDYMTMNHLGPELLPIFMEEPWPGIGFGLGFSVVMDPAIAGTMSTRGSVGWGGAASTNFWVDPVEEIVGILLLQVWPSYTYPTTSDFRTAVYQALME
jgi:CubicO group peptidase (beta-lactamase class C family)